MSNITRALTKLNGMKGKTFLYMGKHEVVLHFQDDKTTERILISTDKKLHTVPYHEAGKYLCDFMGPVSADAPPAALPVYAGHGQPGASVPIGSMPIFIADEENQQFIIQTIRENVGKVKESKDNIPQAFESNQQIKTLLKLTELQLDMAKINAGIFPGKK